MEMILAFLASKFGPWLAAAGAALVAGVGLWLKGKSAGKRAEQDRQNRERLDAIETSRKVEDEVSANDPQKNREDLKRWSRH